MNTSTFLRQATLFLTMVFSTAAFAQETRPLGRANPFQPFTETEYSEKLGIEVEIQRAYGGPYANLKIVSVNRNSVAAKWGFERGDVLVALNGQLTPSAAELDRAFKMAGRTMSVTYINVRTSREETSFVRKPFNTFPPPPPFSDEDPLAKALGMKVKKIWDNQMVVLDPGFDLARNMGLKTGDVIKGFAAVGIPVYPGQPPQEGAILKQLRVFRFGVGEFTINVGDYSTVIFQP